MTIKFLNTDEPLIYLKAVEISAFLDNIDDYTGITVIATLTCGTPITQMYDTTDAIDITKKFYVINDDIEGKVIVVTPQLFNGATKFVDGIYRFDVKFSTTEGYTYISNCSFVDITIACKVAATMQNIIKENQLKTTERISTIIHMLHYSLVNGSDCGCNCDEMCEVYTGLLNLLSDIDPQILNDCGC